MIVVRWTSSLICNPNWDYPLSYNFPPLIKRMDQPKPNVTEVARLLGITFPPMVRGIISENDFLRGLPMVFKQEITLESTPPVSPSRAESLQVLPLDLQRMILSTAGGTGLTISKGTYEKEYRQQSECMMGIRIKEFNDLIKKLSVNIEYEIRSMIIFSRDFPSVPENPLGVSLISCRIIILDDRSIIIKSHAELLDGHMIHITESRRIMNELSFIDFILSKLPIWKKILCFIVPPEALYPIIAQRESCFTQGDINVSKTIYEAKYSIALIEGGAYFTLHPIIMLTYLILMIPTNVDNNTLNLMANRLDKLLEKGKGVFISGSNEENTFMDEVKTEYINRFKDSLGQLKNVLKQHNIV